MPLIFLFSLLSNSLKSHSRVKLGMFVLCLYLMHMYLTGFLKNFILHFFFMFLQKNIGQKKILNFTSYFLKSRGNLPVVFGRHHFYVMNSTDVLSECLQPGYIITRCEVPQWRCDSFPHRHFCLQLLQ